MCIRDRSERGTFNFEGGCYAKTINLSAEAEPEIYGTTSKFGTVVENMVYDPETLELDFDDASLTQNMRCAYPLDYISNASATGLGGAPPVPYTPLAVYKRPISAAGVAADPFHPCAAS